MAVIPGSVRVTGILAPTDSTDTYAVTDTQYGLDGLRNFTGDTSSLTSITAQRRRPGMIAGIVSGDTRLYYRLNDQPWSYDQSDWTQLTLYDYTGNTAFTQVESQYWVSGATGTGLLNVNSSHSVLGEYSIAGGGSGNTVYGNYSVALGGRNNIVSAVTDFISSAAIAGNNNLVQDGVIIGGFFNTAQTSSLTSAIVGGLQNDVAGLTSFIGGGSGNYVGTNQSAIIAGNFNRVTNINTVVAGGNGNSGFSQSSVILGGTSNRTNGVSSVIVGGQNNETNGIFTATLGANLIASGYGQTVVGLANEAQGNPTSQQDDNYMLVVGGGNLNLSQRKNAFAVRQDGALQSLPQTGVTLPATGIQDGALAYSANTGLFQYIGSNWQQLALGAGSQTWDQVLQQGDTAFRSANISGSTSYLNLYNDSGVKWTLGQIASSAIISGATGYLKIGSSIEVRNANSSNFMSMGVDNDGNPSVGGYNGTATGSFSFTAHTAARTWGLPDKSGVVALVSDLSGFTGAQDWNSSLAEGNITADHEPTVSGQSIAYYSNGGLNRWYTRAKTDETFELGSTGATYAFTQDPTGGGGFSANYTDISSIISLQGFNGGAYLRMGTSGGSRGDLVVSGLTAPRAYTFPDATGTVALTSDLSGFTSGESAYWISGATSTSLIYANSAGSTATGSFAFVAQGESNTSNGTYSTVINGAGNTANGSSYAMVINGDTNQALATGAVVINGETNIANSPHAIVLGGTGNEAQNQHTLVSGLNNRAYGEYSQVFGTNNIALGESQFVTGNYNAAQGTSGSSIQTDYVFVLGGGFINQRKNAFAVTKQGMIQMQPFTGATLPTVNVSDGALAYSATTGLYQYVGGIWTGFTSGAGGGGGGTWQESISAGNIVTTGAPTLSGEALTIRASVGATTFDLVSPSNNTLQLTGSTGFGLSLNSKYITFSNEGDNSYTSVGNEAGGDSQIVSYNGSYSSVIEISHNLSANRTWALPDKSGTIALISDVTGATGNTGGAPQTLDCITTTLWDTDFGHNARITLTADTTFNITNIDPGDYGTVVVTQDAVGGHSITPPGSSVVVNGAGGLLNLTANANAVDVLTFYYDGTTYYWNLGGDYT